MTKYGESELSAKIDDYFKPLMDFYLLEIFLFCWILVKAYYFYFLRSFSSFIFLKFYITKYKDNRKYDQFFDQYSTNLIKGSIN